MNRGQHWGDGVRSERVMLVVSPAEADYLALTAILDGTRWRLRFACDCREAWKALHSEFVDVVVAACELLALGAWRDLLGEIRQTHERPTLVLLSDESSDALRREAFDLGALDLLRRPLDGSRVRTCLNLAQPPAERTSTADQGSILVAEAPEVASFIQTLLERHGYRVAICSWARAALLLGQIDVDLVITNRPAEVVASHAGVRVLYTCAVPDPERLRCVPNRAVAVLQKPFLPDDLLRKVRRLLLAPAVAAAELRYRREQAGLRLVRSPLERLQAPRGMPCGHGSGVRRAADRLF